MRIENINNGTIESYSVTLRTPGEFGVITREGNKTRDSRKNNYKVNGISRDYTFEDESNNDQNNYLPVRPYNSSGESSFEEILNKHIDILA